MNLKIENLNRMKRIIVVDILILNSFLLTGQALIVENGVATFMADTTIGVPFYMPLAWDAGTTMCMRIRFAGWWIAR